MDAAGAVDAQNAPTAPWKSLRDSHKRPPPSLAYATEEETARLRARSESDDTRTAYHVAAFQPFLSGRISTFGDSVALRGQGYSRDFLKAVARICERGRHLRLPPIQRTVLPFGATDDNRKI